MQYLPRPITKAGSLMTLESELILFHHHKSTCSQKVRLCLAEKRISWVGRFVDIAKEKNLSPEYLAINPNGVVPAILHQGRAVIESSVILEYLDEAFDQGTRMVPEDPIDRANMRAWMRFIDEVPSMAVRVPSYQLVLRKRFDSMSEDEYQQFIQKNPVRNEFFRRMGRDGFNKVEYGQSILRLEHTVQRMSTALQETTWLCSHHYGLADIALVPIFQRLKELDLVDLLQNEPRVVSWFDHAEARNSFATTFYPGARFFDEDIH